MNINGKYGMIFHNEKDGKTWINLSDSSKNLDETYTNQSWTVRFKKGTEIPTDRSKINYKGFMSYWKPNDKTFTTIQITEWNYVDEQPKQEVKQEETKNKFNPFDSVKEDKNEDPFSSASAIEIGDDDLPF